MPIKSVILFATAGAGVVSAPAIRIEEYMHIKGIVASRHLSVGWPPVLVRATLSDERVTEGNTFEIAKFTLFGTAESPGDSVSKVWDYSGQRRVKEFIQFRVNNEGPLDVTIKGGIIYEDKREK